MSIHPNSSGVSCNTFPPENNTLVQYLSTVGGLLSTETVPLANCKYHWGEPERAPHRRVCCKFSIYIFIYIFIYNYIYICIYIYIFFFNTIEGQPHSW